MIQINAVGDACPLPVIKTKKALQETASGSIEVLVDNQTAVENIQRYVDSLGLISQASKEENVYKIVIHKDGMDAPVQKLQQAAKSSGNLLVILSSDTMGTGDDTLGQLLMKGFVFALTQADVLPDTILLYNGGAKMSIHGAASLEDLRTLERAGVKIMTCGTCLEHYGITDQLAVGEVTNMYSILEEMQAADRILRP